MKLKLILKGVLLYITAFATVLFISSIDDIFEVSVLLGLFIITNFISLYYICYNVISEEELEMLTFCKYLGINIKDE